jgi:hypothetical protein
MRTSLAIMGLLLLARCASLPPAPPHGMPVAARHPTATLERPWLTPTPNGEITLFDSRALQALRKLDEASAPNQNGTGRRVRHPGMWAGIGVGAAVGVAVVTEAIDDVVDDTTDNFFDCFFEVFFGGDCDDED